MANGRHYLPISESMVPANIRFTVPRRNQGQHIEVAYGNADASEGCDGDPYKRVTDTSVYPHAINYYRNALIR